MAATTERTRGPLETEELVPDSRDSDPSTERAIRFVEGKGLVIYTEGIVTSVGETKVTVWQPTVDTIDIDTPPGSPTAGDRMVVGDAPTDDFIGHTGEIAQWDGSDWVFIEPKEGTIVYAKDDNTLYKQENAAAAWLWTEAASGSSSGITADQHRVLRQLIHFIDGGPAEGFTSGAYREILPTADPFPTSIIWWESSSKLKKIVEKLKTYTGILPTTIEWNVYDTDGSTKLGTASDSVNYSGIFETNRTRTITVY